LTAALKYGTLNSRSSLEVQLSAAGALWKINQRADPLVPVLIAGLGKDLPYYERKVSADPCSIVFRLAATLAYGAHTSPPGHAW